MKVCRLVLARRKSKPLRNITFQLFLLLLVGYNNGLPSCPKKVDSSYLSKEEQESALKQHNKFRQQILDGRIKGLPRAIELPMLKWSTKLEAEAKRWCELCPDPGKGEAHPPRSWPKFSYGQNMAWGQSSLEKAIDAWFEEYEEYVAAGVDPLIMSSNSKLGPNGHFTQMVSKRSTEIGCWKVKADWFNMRVFYCCNYSPPGNMIINGIKEPAYEAVTKSKQPSLLSLPPKKKYRKMGSKNRREKALPSCRQDLDQSSMTIEEKETSLALHNKFRGQIREGLVKGLPRAKKLPDIKWSSKLEREARRWCEICPDKKNGKPPKSWKKLSYGQNIAWGENNVTKAITSWFNQHKKLSWQNPIIGHASLNNLEFTQIVSDKVEKVGCWKVEAEWLEMKSIFCCNYSPPGHVMKTFGNGIQKVLPAYEAIHTKEKKLHKVYIKKTNSEAMEEPQLSKEINKPKSTKRPRWIKYLNKSNSTKRKRPRRKKEKNKPKSTVEEGLKGWPFNKIRNKMKKNKSKSKKPRRISSAKRKRLEKEKARLMERLETLMLELK